MTWASYFEKNRDNRRNIPWERGITIDEHVRGPLVRSLQRFQIGESGEGVHMKRGAARTGDAGYLHAVQLFIAEEQVHSSWMATALGLMNAPLLTGHWSDVAFIALRRLMGLTTEVMVLLAAETVGKHYFRVVHRGIDDLVLRTMYAQMISDEEGHIAFQVDSLRRAFAREPRLLRGFRRAMWWTVYHAAFVVVIWDHRHLFRALNVSPTEFMIDCDDTYGEISSVLFPRRKRAVEGVAAAGSTNRAAV